MAGIPILIVLGATIVIVICFTEVGFRIGRDAHRRDLRGRSASEKESPAGTVATAMLGLLAFILGFTFSLVADRYQTRKVNVREEVYAIQTAYLRSDFLPEPDRGEVKRLLERYVESILDVSSRGATPTGGLHGAFAGTNHWHRRLWEIAVQRGRELDSEIGALYIESINEVFTRRTQRAMIEMTERVKPPLWAALYILTLLAVTSLGYHEGISGSKRSKINLLMAASFALVIALIVDLDRMGGYITVSQQPFEELHRSMVE
jgi:hypothetical protein